MPTRAELNDEEWRTFYSLLRVNPSVHIGPEENCKRFLNAVLWVLRSGTVEIAACFTGQELGV
jgi:hypothetical protein